jgi:hypothetical protein
MKPEIDATIQRLIDRSFVPDPLIGDRCSRLVSVMSSAYKRHGVIIEKAILAELKKCPRFDVWDEPEFQVCADADLLANGALKDPMSIIGNRVNYRPGPRALQVDIVVYDRIRRKIRSYEVKRGFGYHDAGKKRSILRDTLCQTLLLKSYGEQRGLRVDDAEAKAIFYYGARSIQKPFSLIGSELDEHFDWPVIGAIEQVNAYFREKLFEFCDQDGLGVNGLPPLESERFEDQFGLDNEVENPIETDGQYSDLSEDEAYEMLNLEISGCRREEVALALFEQYNKLRGDREKAEIETELREPVPYFLRGQIED